MKIPAELDTDALLAYLDKGWDRPVARTSRRTPCTCSPLYGRKETAKADALAQHGRRDRRVRLRVPRAVLRRHGGQAVRPGGPDAAEELRPRGNANRHAGRHGQRLALVRRRHAGQGAAAHAVRARPARFPARARAGQRPPCLQRHAVTGRTRATPGGSCRHSRRSSRADNETNADFTAQREARATGACKNSFRGFSRAPFQKQVTRERSRRRSPARERGRSAPRGRSFRSPSASTGKGTLYYTAELRYAIGRGDVEPRDEGIGIAAEILDEKGDRCRARTSRWARSTR